MFNATVQARMLNKYGPKMASHRPEHFALATDPNREQQRAWVNHALQELDPEGCARLFRNIQTSNRFLQSYNELAVAAILQSCGMRLAYEKSIDGLTPDFVTVDADDRPTHLIEVMNRRRPKPVDSASTRWDELCDRFAKIEKPWRLRVATFPHVNGAPAADVAIDMVRQIEAWLASDGITLGEGCSNGDYSFLIVANSPGTNVKLLTPVEEVWVNSDALADAIREKVSRYASLAERLQVPLTVIVGADDKLAVSAGLVRSALAGQLTTSVNLNIFGIGSGASSSGPLKMHATDAPRAWSQSLSAVGWLEAGIDGPGTLTVFAHEHALRHHGLPATADIQHAG